MSQIEKRTNEYQKPANQDLEMHVAKPKIIDFNFTKHFEDLEAAMNERVLVNCIENGLKKTLIRKKIITSPQQFKTEPAMKQCNEHIKMYVDKMEAWTRGNISESKTIENFEEKQRQKRLRIQKKVQSIANLSKRIAQKIVKSNLQAEKQRFQDQLIRNRINIPQSPEYQNALYKMKQISSIVNIRTNEINKKMYELKKEIERN